MLGAPDDFSPEPDPALDPELEVPSLEPEDDEPFELDEEVASDSFFDVDFPLEVRLSVA